jgi:hypothetical protein
MWMYDVETLGIESNSVILSMALVYFDLEKKPTYEDLIKDAFFVKLNAKDQLQRLGRTVTKSTLDWWEQQAQSVKDLSLNPSSNDVLAEDALDQMKAYVDARPEAKKAIVWARGNLDQMVLGSLEDKLKRDNIFHFGRWRDVRTAVDLLTGSTNGYCTIQDFNDIMVVKHNPIHDCAYDAMMLMYGRK